MGHYCETRIFWKICIFSVVIYYYQNLASCKNSWKFYVAFLRKSFVSRYDGCRTDRRRQSTFAYPCDQKIYGQKNQPTFFLMKIMIDVDENVDILSLKWQILVNFEISAVKAAFWQKVFHATAFKYHSFLFYFQVKILKVFFNNVINQTHFLNLMSIFTQNF